MEFRWDPAQNDRITTPALFHYGTSWDPVVSGIGSSPNSTTLSHTDYWGTFSPFAIGQLSGTLPVVWKSFIAEKRNTNVLLRWETSSETNTKKYVVEHSTNGRTWQPIGDVAAAGNSSIVTSYEFVHVQPSAGNNHYRIRQIDLDDKFSWSRVEVIRFDMRSSILVHPNPTTNQLVVEQRGGSVTNGTLRMMDIHGKVIRTLPLTQIRTILDVSALSAGMYFIQLNQDAPIGFIKQ